MRPVAPEHARLPAGEAILVQQLEVEERADRRLAACEEQCVPQLACLVANPRLGTLGRDRRDDVPVRLRSAVQVPLRAWNGGLEARLEVPHAGRAFERDRLGRPVEPVADRDEQPVEVALPHCPRVRVHDPRRLGCVVGVRVVPERVDERVSPPLLPIRLTDLAHEAGRVVVRGGRADHVDRTAQRVEPPPARGEERFVRTCTSVLRPELRRVRLVPDDDVAERDAHEDVVEEVAVLLPARGVERSIGGPPEDADDDPLTSLDQHRRPVEVDAHAGGLRLAASIRDRQANSAEPEIPVLRDEAVRSREPLRVVVVDTDHERAELRRDLGCARIGRSQDRARQRADRCAQ